MSTFLNSLKVAGIAIAVALIGGLIQALSNFHPTDQLTNFIMTVGGGAAIAALNALMHKLQGTTVAPVASVNTPTTVTTTTKA